MNYSMRISVFLFTAIIGLGVMAGVSSEKHQGPTGLTIEVPSAGSGGPKDDVDYMSTLFKGSESIAFISTRNRFHVMNEGIEMGLTYLGPIPSGLFINDNGYITIKYFYDPATLNTLPGAMSILYGSRSSNFMQECTGTLVQTGSGQTAMASAFIDFWEIVFYIATTQGSITNQDINDLVTRWQNVNSVL